MIEIPESHTLAHQLSKTVIGKTVAQTIASQSPHGFAWYYGDPADYDARLRGRTIDSAVAHAGYVEMQAGDHTILISEGANLRYLEPGKSPPKKHQLYIRFSDDSALVCTTSMYGLYYVYPAGAHDNIYYQAALSTPAPLTDAFTTGHFASLLTDESRKLSAKAFLATEQRIPGLGNGCLQDILFFADVHPRRKMHTLSDTDFGKLYHTVRDKLAEMTLLGGRDTEKDLFGNVGGYHAILSKNTVGHACPLCGNTIQRQAFLGGNIYFCPGCQPL